MTVNVLIKKGKYGKRTIVDQKMPLAQEYRPDKGYITVAGTKETTGVSEPRNCRIIVDGPEDFQVLGEIPADCKVAGANNTPAVLSVDEEALAAEAQERAAEQLAIAEYKANETDEQALMRIRKSFHHLDLFADAAAGGTIRGLVVVGEPGIGKSHGVGEILKQASLTATIAGDRAKYEIIKGSISATMLYRKLFQFKDEDQVLVLDDVEIDTIEAINLVKAALDSGEKREISWYKDALWLKNDDIPEKFEFEGSIIVLTNADMAGQRGNRGTHLGAVVSRCHYMDLEIESVRDKLLRIEDVVSQGMLRKYGFTNTQEQQIVNYVKVNKEHMRELSLRMVIKIADLFNAFPKDWEDMAEASCMVPSAKYARMVQK